MVDCFDGVGGRAAGNMEQKTLTARRPRSRTKEGNAWRDVDRGEGGRPKRHPQLCKREKNVGCKKVGAMEHSDHNSITSLSALHKSTTEGALDDYIVPFLLPLPFNNDRVGYATPLSIVLPHALPSIFHRAHVRSFVGQRINARRVGDIANCDLKLRGVKGRAVRERQVGCSSVRD